MAQPELVDPIYLDLRAKVKEYEALVVEDEKTIKSLREEVNLAQPQSGDRKRLLPRVDAAEQRLIQNRQMARYYTLRSQTRVGYARKAYLKIFEAGGVWPDKEEHERFLTNQRLISAPRSWETRVPKMKTSRNDN